MNAPSLGNCFIRKQYRKKVMGKIMNPYIHKVHYYETDKMGIVHHSNYIRWMEEARIDFLSQIGWDFDKLEEMGIISPVLAVECRYKEVTRFPEEIQIDVFVKEFKGVRLILGYNMRKKGEENVVTVGTTEHAFLDENYRPLRLKKTHPEFCQALMDMVVE